MAKPTREQIKHRVTGDVSYTSGTPKPKVDEADELRTDLAMEKPDLIKLTQLLRGYMADVPKADRITFKNVNKSKQTVKGVIDLVKEGFDNA